MPEPVPHAGANTEAPRVKRAYVRRKLKAPRSSQTADKPRIGLPDPLEATQEAARLAQNGNLKLAKAVDCLRQGLETIVTAEMDRRTGLAVSAKELRMLAAATLDAYSAICGQSWRRHKLIGDRSGDRDLSTLDNA
jgi:hypothetical protein